MFLLELHVVLNRFSKFLDLQGPLILSNKLLSVAVSPGTGTVFCSHKVCFWEMQSFWFGVNNVSFVFNLFKLCHDTAGGKLCCSRGRATFPPIMIWKNSPPVHCAVSSRSQIRLSEIKRIYAWLLLADWLLWEFILQERRYSTALGWINTCCFSALKNKRGK